ncbi:MAG: AAA family ATPase [Nocardioides sp.]|uniref:ATP-binding protein n=1 Tax=Nocardioides sp. TaxID=35761 RepID=UPI00326715BC
MGALPRPDLEPGPARELNDALHELHHRAGWPSLRTLAHDAGCSHTTVSHVFSSAKLPSWGVVELLVEAMGGRTSHVHDLWLAASSPGSNGARPVPRIAGRRTELVAVRRHLESGSGLLLVTGEAGMGKTTLIEAARAQVRHGVLVASGSCLPLSTEIPLLPVAEALRQVGAVTGGQVLADVLRRSPEYVTVSLATLLPELARSTALTDPHDEWSRPRLFSAIAAVLETLADQHSFALIVEDLHWADMASLDLVEHLVHSTRLRILATWRLDDPDVPQAKLTWWNRMRRSATSLELTPLSREDTTAQLQLLRPDITDAVAHRIHERTQGQPLFTEHLVHEESGVSSTYLAELLDARIGRLRGDTWQSATVLGVADRPMTEAALVRATGLGRVRVAASLREMRDARLLEALGDRVHLRHPLLAEAVRRKLLPGEAADVHRALARTMSCDPTAEPAEVAAHWQGAAEMAEELSWRIRAAQAASARFAGSQAANHWLRALELWPNGADEAGEPPVRRYTIIAGAVVAQLEIAGQERTVRPLLEAAQAAREEFTDAEYADLLRLLARFNSTQLGGSGLGLQLIDQSIALFRSMPPSEGLASALNWKGAELEWHGRRLEATTTLVEAARVASQVGDATLARAVRAQKTWQQAATGDEGAVAAIKDLMANHSAGRDPKDDLYLAIRHTDILLMACRPAVEVQAAARPALDSAARWHMNSARTQVLMCNVAAAWRRAGRITAAREAVTDPTPGTDVDVVGSLFVHAERALLEVLADHLDAARRLMDELPVQADGAVDPVVVDARMQLDLWAGDPEGAWHRFETLLDTRDDEISPGTVGDLLALAARAAADMAHDSRNTFDAERDDLHRAVRTMRSRLHHDPYAPSAVAADRAALPQWSAELKRIRGTDNVDTWVRAATAWDKLTRPHDSAYCRWRAAQVAIRDDQGTAAARLLKRAATDAREHVPLLAAIRKTAAGRS